METIKKRLNDELKVKQIVLVFDNVKCMNEIMCFVNGLDGKKFKIIVTTRISSFDESIMQEMSEMSVGFDESECTQILARYMKEKIKPLENNTPNKT